MGARYLLRREPFEPFWRIGCNLAEDWEACLSSPEQASWQDEGKQVVYAKALPGLAKEDVRIELQNSYLHISAEQKRKHEKSFWSSQFSERIFIPQELNTDSVKAEMKNGLLKIYFEKINHGKYKKNIEVSGTTGQVEEAIEVKNKVPFMERVKTWLSK